jgi:hypothetical protein
MVVRLIVQTLVSFGLMGLFLFGAAGTADWPAAWVFLVEMTVLSIVGGLWLVRHDPALVQERLAPPIQKGQPTADKVLLQVIILVIFGAIVLMALDAVRFAWSSVPFWVQAFGELVLLLSIWISFRTLGETASRRPSSKSKRVEGRRFYQWPVPTCPASYVCKRPYVSCWHFLATGLLVGSPHDAHSHSPARGSYSN